MKKKIIPVIVLFVICFAVTALVACADLLTKDKIEENEANKAKKTMQALISDATEFKDITTSAFESYEAVNASGETVGYIFVTVGKGGYSGDITVMTALDTKGVVTGLEITADEETQGLGKNAHNENFRNQYIGKAVDVYKVIKGEASADGEIEALSGATKTSNAVTNAVNLAKEAFNAMNGEAEK